jgi:hypothetical protein
MYPGVHYSGTPAKKRTIPHFPFPPLVFKGFPAIKNLGSLREWSGWNLTYQKIVDFGNWWLKSTISTIPSSNVAIVAIVAIVD